MFIGRLPRAGAVLFGAVLAVCGVNSRAAVTSLQQLPTLLFVPILCVRGEVYFARVLLFLLGVASLTAVQDDELLYETESGPQIVTSYGNSVIGCVSNPIQSVREPLVSRFRSTAACGCSLRPHVVGDQSRLPSPLWASSACFSNVWTFSAFSIAR